MISSFAYLLVFHGSRDFRTQAAAANLKNLLIAKYQSNNILTQYNYLSKNSCDFESKLSVESTIVSDLSSAPLIEVVPLELGDEPLSQSLVKFAQKSHRQGLKRIKVVPLFLAPGVHVQSDVPAAIALALQQLNHQVTIELSPYTGKYSAIISLLENRFDRLSAQTRILLAHGSKLVSAKDYYQNLSQKLSAEVAYWSMMPKLTEQIKDQIAFGSRKIAILPYFLFPGKITEAIATEVAQLQTTYPRVELILDQPLGITSAFAELIFQEI